MSYSVLKVEPDTTLLNPHFDGYKLQLVDNDEVVRVFPFPSAGYMDLPKLPRNSLVTFDETYYRIHYNHLFAGSASDFMYIDCNGVVYNIDLTDANKPKTTQIWTIPHRDNRTAGGYPGIYLLVEGLLLVYDGIDMVYVLNRQQSSDGDEWALRAEFEIGIGDVIAGSQTSSTSDTMYYILGVCICDKTDAIRLLYCHRNHRGGNSKKPPFSICAIEVALPETTISDTSKTAATLEPSVIHTLQSHAISSYCSFLANHRMGSYILGVRGGVVMDESELSSRPHSPSSTVLSTAPEISKDLYYWSQTRSDVTVCIQLPYKLTTQQISCSLTQRSLTLKFNDDGPLDQYTYDAIELYDVIDTEESVWTLEGGQLFTLHLQKANEGKRWPNLFSRDDGVLETMDSNDFAAIKERLEKYTSDSIEPTSYKKPVSVMDSIAQNDVDMEDQEEGQSVGFSVRDWKTGQAIASSVAGSPDWLCPTFESTAKQPLPICLQFDVDGVVFKFNSDTNVQMKHVETFAALSYIQASKREKRFMYVAANMTKAILAETHQRIYIYHQTIDKKSANAVQNVIDLGSKDEEILGLQMLEDQNLLVVLRERSWCLIDIDKRQV